MERTPWAAMNNVFAAIFVFSIVVIVAFIGLGGSFNTQFWITFLPGLMGNLAALAIAILVVDRIFKKERLDKLEQTNAGQSSFVLLINNRLAFKLLEHLGLAASEEVANDSALNFDFALERLKTIDLPATFYAKLMESDNKEAFADGFEKILSRETGGISKALDNVYPRPDPTLKLAQDEMLSSIGSLSALVMLCQSYREANAQLIVEDQLKPEHLNLLIKLGYSRIAAGLQGVQDSVINLSNRAKANKLYLSFD